MEERPQPDFTLDEVAREMLEELGMVGHDDPGFSAKELAEAWGVATSTARRRIQGLKEQGKVVEGRRGAKRKDGTFYYLPVYRLKKDKGEGTDPQ